MNTNNNNKNLSSYQFQPIDQDFSSNSRLSQLNNSHLIQRPEKPLQYSLQAKRNSIVNIDPTIRSYGLPRSVTSDQLANNIPQRLYYCPSVQDVLDALNRRSFDKESFV